MDEALGPSIEDYLRSIRRNGRWVAIVAVIGAVLLAGLNAVGGGVSSRYRTVVQLSALDESSVALSFGLPPDIVSQRPLTQDAVRLRESLRNELKDKLPDGAVVSANGNDVSRTFTVTAVADTAADAKQAADLAVASLVDDRRSTTTDRLKAVDSFNTDRMGALNERIAAVDGDLAKAAGEDARRSLELERISLVQEFIVAQRTSIGAKQLLSSSRGGITDPVVVVAPKSELSLGWVTSAIVGLILGLLLAVAWVVVRTYLDRRVRSRADIELASPSTDVLGVVPARDDAARTAGYATVARRLAAAGGSGRLVVVACNDPADATAASSELERLGAGDATAGAGVGRDGSVVRSLSPGDRVVLVASHGTTSRDDVAASVGSVDAAQAVLSGLVLVGVPPRELGLALRGRSVMRDA